MDVRDKFMNESGEGADSITVTMRSYFSSQYLWSVEHHAVLAKEIEEEHHGESRFSIRHRVYVVSAITDSVAFLEAAVNELIQDVADGHESYIGPLSSEAQQRLYCYWKYGDRANVLDKYGAVLQLATGGDLDRGSAPTQSVIVLISLRNYLVHYRPEDVGVSIDPPKLARSLARRFPDNRLMARAGNPWFPDHALGAG